MKVVKKVVKFDRSDFEKLAIFAAVSTTCQAIYAADSVLNLPSPFYPEPLNLIDEQSTKPQYEDKPHVMLVLDDSDSMKIEVFPTGVVPKLCANSYVVVAERNASPSYLNSDNFGSVAAYEHIEPGCHKMIAEDNGSIRYIYPPDALGSAETVRAVDAIPDYRNNMNYYKKRYFISGGVNAIVKKIKMYYSTEGSLGTRVDILKNSLEKTLPNYNNRIKTNILTYWGSENPDKIACPHFNYTNEYYPSSVYPEKSKIPFYLSPERVSQITGKYNIGSKDYRRDNIQVGADTPRKILLSDIRPNGVNPFYDPNDVLSLIRKISADSTVKIKQPYGSIEARSCIGTTPSTLRYIQAAKILQDTYAANQRSETAQCQSNHIIVFSDGDARETLGRNTDHAKIAGLPKERKDYEIFDPNNIYGNIPSSYTFNGTTEDNGIAYFSKKLFYTDKLGGTNAQTYTIGFGDSLSEDGRKYLVRAATAQKDGKPSKEYIDKKGKLKKYGYWDALTPKDLEDAFSEIFENIIASSTNNAIDTGSVSSPGNVSSSKTGIAATLTLYTGNWSSLLKFFELDSAGKPKIGASKNAEYVNERSVLVSSDRDKYWLMQNSNLNNKLKLSSTGAAEDEVWLANAMNDFGFDNKEEFTKAFVPWLVREKGISDDRINALIKNVENRKVSIYRNRLSDLPPDVGDDKLLYRQMGDVLAAPVVGIDAGKNGSNRRYVVTGANDGMVYIFQNTDKSDTPYTLKLNYIPAGIPREGSDDTLAKNLYKLAKNNYGSSDNPHIYGVNGGITYVKTSQTAKKKGDSAVKRPQEILALGAMGQGGRGIYALKIAGCDRDGDTAGCDPVGLDADLSKWQTSVPLWESKAVPDDPSVNKSVNEKERVRLGYTVGKPLMYQLATKWNIGKAITTDGVRVAGFVGNGFPPLNDSLPYDTRPTLYVYDVLGEEIGTDQEAGKSSMVGNAGTLLGKISVKKSDIRDDITLLNGSSGVGALSSPAVVDVNRDGIADIAYAGDYAGNLYRFDLRGEPSEWEAVKIYQGNTVLLSNGKKLATQPITAAPSVYRDSSKKLIVLFGTGSDLFEGDVIPRSCDSLTDNAVKKLCKEKQYWDYRQGFFGIKDDISVTGSSISPISRDQLVLQSFSSKKEDGSEYRDFETEKLVPVAGKGWWFELNSGETGSVAGRSNTVRTKSAEKAVTKPVVLLDTVFFSTRIYHYDEINKENIGTAQCPIDKSGKKSGGESWLMGVNVFTGATPSGVTFKDKKNAGIKLDHLASGVVLNQSASRKMENALKNNSEVGDGVLGDLNDPPTEPKKCLTSDDYFLMLSQASKDNPLYSKEVTGPICPNPGLLVRLNIHEIIE